MARSATAGRGKQFAYAVALLGALGCSVYEESMLSPDGGTVATGGSGGTDVGKGDRRPPHRHAGTDTTGSGGAGGAATGGTAGSGGTEAQRVPAPTAALEKVAQRDPAAPAQREPVEAEPRAAQPDRRHGGNGWLGVTGGAGTGGTGATGGTADPAARAARRNGRRGGNGRHRCNRRRGGYRRHGCNRRRRVPAARRARAAQVQPAARRVPAAQVQRWRSRNGWNRRRGKGGTGGGTVDAGPDGGPGPTGGGAHADHRASQRQVHERPRQRNRRRHQHRAADAPAPRADLPLPEPGAASQDLARRERPLRLANGPATNNYVVELRTSSTSTLQQVQRRCSTRHLLQPRQSSSATASTFTCKHSQRRPVRDVHVQRRHQSRV